MSGRHQHHSHHHHHHNLHHPGKSSHSRSPDPLAQFDQRWYNSRPTLGQWFRQTWFDILWMAMMGAVGLGVYMAPPAPTRSFPVYYADGEVVYPQFAYPLRRNIIPIFASALLSSLIPFAFYLLFQIRVRSFWDVNAAILGTLYSLINAAVFQVFLKWLIGGLRPHFLTVCRPRLPADGGPQTGNGFREIMYTREICTGDEKEINDALESFPSGHSTAAFAGFVFLFLYFNAKLKTWSNYHPTMWKQTVTFAPLLGATLIAASLTIDEFHNWYDCLAGALIGTMMAFGSYRAVYAAIWDYRFNHIPLPRGTNTLGFDPVVQREEMATFGTAVFTRKAGWGILVPAVVRGAPPDSSMV
ncbi:phosphatidic acid phosphatase type 2/haloperoxidase [Kalaharituber pfeilii]|nr:phosphatidic acid phosphatase type 2/haloperoxidase [Kalaharituber pfeilii]